MEDLFQVQEVSRDRAALAFEAVAGLNPSGYESPKSMAARGHAFELTTDHGSAIYSVCRDGNTLWCIAAVGQGSGMTRAGLACLERQARANRCDRVGFQTLRLGLVRIAEKHGYEVARQVGAGFVLEKRV